MSGREKLALNEKARSQSLSGPPVQEMVTVAVLPPRLPPNVVPTYGIGTAGVFDYDETVNWQHNERLPKDGGVRKMSFLEKAGLTTWRNRRDNDVPPYVMRQVPYDTWRKHYAKDKDGNYRGTHAPAEDCLLKPDDVKKWSAVEPETYGDTWTRGKETLPGYGEVNDQGTAPEYADATELASEDKHNFVERTVSDVSAHNQPPASTVQGSGRTIDGKTSAQYIADAKAKIAAKQKESWKDKLSRGATAALLGD